MRILLVIISVALLHTATANANETTGNCALPSQANVKVNGLVCDFCARALEKVFNKQTSVSNINVDLDAGNVVVNFNPDQSIDDQTLTSLITDSGYDVVGIEHRC